MFSYMQQQQQQQQEQQQHTLKQQEGNDYYDHIKMPSRWIYWCVLFQSTAAAAAPVSERDLIFLIDLV